MCQASRVLPLIVFAALVAACGGAVAPPAASSPTPVPSAATTPMPAGTYTTTAFQPALTFTVPDGWELVDDTPTWVHLQPIGSPDLGLYVFRNAFALSQDPACPTTAEPGVGKTSSELVTWMRSLPGVTAGSPALATIGGLRGAALDLGIKDGWTVSCPFANGVPTTALIRNDGIERWVLAGAERLRMYLLDLPDGGNIIVDVDDFAGSSIDSLLSAAAPIIKSFQFATK